MKAHRTGSIGNRSVVFLIAFLLKVGSKSPAMSPTARTGGRLHASVREGEGEDVSTYGSAAAPRRYVETYWREPTLRSALTDAGWIVSEIRRCVGKPHDRWLSVRATRA